jgi:hypothetical protein
VFKGSKHSIETINRLKKVNHWWNRGEKNYGWRGGITKNPIYSVWVTMYSRCYNKKLEEWNNYGERGIKLSKSWHDPKNFIDDMFPTYVKGLTIERIAHNKRKRSKSGYFGVYAHVGKLAEYEGRKKKWYIELRKNGKRYCGGYFETSKEAALKYNKLALRIHGKFARLNTII